MTTLRSPNFEADAQAPLVAIERAVQERAKELALDMSGLEGPRRLRTLIDEELDRWDDDVRRGRRAYPIGNPDLVAERAWRNLAEHGPLTELLG